MRGHAVLLPVLLLAGLASLAAGAFTPRQVRQAEDAWLEASGWVLAQRRASGSWSEALDPALSGLIGSEDGLLTTSLGQLDAKLAAAQSGWCRVVACLLDSLGIGPADTVAVAMTGSFPGLNLAVLLTLEAGGIPYRCVSSLGASTFGANEPGFNWPLVEDWLRERSLLRMGSMVVTPGGSGDRLNGLTLEAVRAAGAALRPHGESLHPTNLHQAVELRREVFGPRSHLALLINIGGNHAVLGGNDFGRQVPGGLLGAEYAPHVQQGEGEAGTVGVMQLYWQEGLPVLHLSDIVRLAKRWGLPVPPREARTPAAVAKDCRPAARPARRP
ncbi:MAG: poly-gamma-glutamate system protein [bacterium]|nr:poly-gamma-glutamate system protein [bacterium]